MPSSTDGLLPSADDGARLMIAGSDAVIFSAVSLFFSFVPCRKNV